ncbi:hypothetical protein N4P33_34490, partial [Streptomyces sp. 15-116A]|nr:hypothetical protein [Streptomyces sp. 15-116A]
PAGHALIAAPTAPDPGPDVPAFHSPGTQPSADDTCVVAPPVLLRVPRDAGERSVPAAPLLFTPPYTPRVPPRPAAPVPVAGNAPPAAAHLPSDLGRAPPAPSST